jgi:hypothetical protein
MGSVEVVTARQWVEGGWGRVEMVRAKQREEVPRTGGDARPALVNERCGTAPEVISGAGASRASAGVMVGQSMVGQSMVASSVYHCRWHGRTAS